MKFVICNKFVSQIFNYFWHVKFWENFTSTRYRFVNLTYMPLYLWISIKSFSTILFICTSHYLGYLRIRRTVTMIVNLPVTPEKCHHTTSWNVELVHLMEGIVSLHTLVALKRAGCVRPMRQLECHQATSHSQQLFVLCGYDGNEHQWVFGGPHWGSRRLWQKSTENVFKWPKYCSHEEIRVKELNAGVRIFTRST